MQYSDKKETRKKMKKNIRCTYKDYVIKITLYAFQSHIWAVHIYVLGSDYKI